jgi:hypothetical protein
MKFAEANGQNGNMQYTTIPKESCVGADLQKTEYTAISVEWVNKKERSKRKCKTSITKFYTTYSENRRTIKKKQ